jgi:hypothetical protein
MECLFWLLKLDFDPKVFHRLRLGHVCLSRDNKKIYLRKPGCVGTSVFVCVYASAIHAYCSFEVWYAHP